MNLYIEILAILLLVMGIFFILVITKALLVYLFGSKRCKKDDLDQILVLYLGPSVFFFYSYYLLKALDFLAVGSPVEKTIGIVVYYIGYLLLFIYPVAVCYIVFESMKHLFIFSIEQRSIGSRGTGNILFLSILYICLTIAMIYGGYRLYQIVMY